MESAESFGFDAVLKLNNLARDIVRIDDSIINTALRYFRYCLFGIKSEGNFGGNYRSKLRKFWEIS